MPIDLRLFLHVSIRDYLEKTNRQTTAAVFAREAGVPCLTDFGRPYDIPGALLKEWWSQFYDVYTSREQKDHDLEPVSMPQEGAQPPVQQAQINMLVRSQNLPRFATPSAIGWSPQRGERRIGFPASGFGLSHPQQRAQPLMQGFPIKMQAPSENLPGFSSASITGGVSQQRAGGIELPASSFRLSHSQQRAHPLVQQAQMEMRVPSQILPGFAAASVTEVSPQQGTRICLSHLTLFTQLAFARCFDSLGIELPASDFRPSQSHERGQQVLQQAQMQREVSSHNLPGFAAAAFTGESTQKGTRPGKRLKHQSHFGSRRDTGLSRIIGYSDVVPPSHLSGNAIPTAGGSSRGTILPENHDKCVSYGTDELPVTLKSVENKTIRHSLHGSTDQTEGFPLKEVYCISSNKSAVLCCHFSSDGELLASAGNDRKVVIWDTCKLDAVISSEEHSFPITDVRFRSNSCILATSSYDRTIKIWDATNLHCSRDKLSGKESFMSVDFHPEKVELLCSSDLNSDLTLWNVDQSSCIRSSKGATGQVRFQRQGGLLLAAGLNNVVNIFDVEMDKLNFCLGAHGTSVLSLCWEKTGKYIATVSEDSACIWSVASGGLAFKLISNARKYRSCTFHPSNFSLLIGGEKTMEFWDPSSQESITYPAHSQLIDSLSSSSTGWIASASWDHTVKLWK